MAPAGPEPLPLLSEFLAAQERRAQLYGSFQAAFRGFLRDRDEGRYKRSIQEVTLEFGAVSQQVRALEAALAAPRGGGGAGRPDLAALLRRVQNAEADKLRLTVSWQALRDASTPQALAAAGGAPRRGGGPEGPGEALARQLQGIAVEAAAGAGGGACCGAHGGHAHAHENGAPVAPAAGGADAAKSHAGDQEPAVHAPAPAAGAAAGDEGCAAAPSGGGGGTGPGGVLYGADGIAAPLAADVAAATREAARGLDGAIEEINAALEEVREAADDLRRGGVGDEVMA
ncbi:hypothetical protein MNEG_8148 [Monoraphidium neglectum]|uniref:Uncharacterized protein n=1 Tax=Monoraphidium neglectum TaxID=145388 RepID=A0A0D2KX07_9CHLO|nr:hypothetical protein MNEG_8148 [Monoraphidium neglectum]KIY99813.1 hypothetical protein MNEG_8148 [Monoraphidium neglectum]|eukprot:XP_013898833.1 hypothetical protein MNEG_8148 [Monoraphidium neglectum]